MVYLVLGGGWPIADRVVPAGTIYNGSRPEDIAWTSWINASGAAWWAPPACCQAHDQEAYDAQRGNNHIQWWQIPNTPPGINRW
jgi:hypothetical protein